MRYMNDDMPKVFVVPFVQFIFLLVGIVIVANSLVCYAQSTHNTQSRTLGFSNKPYTTIFVHKQSK